MRKYQLYILCGVTVICFPLLGWVINAIFSEHSFWDQFNSTYHIAVQLLIGGLYGCFSGLICWLIIRSRLMEATRAKYVDRIKALGLNNIEIILVSICAGIGEEILFRGILQDYMGVVLTSIVFVGIHGYFTTKHWSIFLYGLAMTVIIVGIGFAYVEMGVIAPIVAHTIIDVILLYLISKYEDTASDPDPITL